MAAKETLRKCPVCSTKITDEVKKLMGIRHYQKMDALLPGKVRGMDIDYVLDQSKTGRFLVIEFKPTKAKLGTGQRLTLKRFRDWGADVWIISDGKYDKDQTIDVGIMDKDGMVREWFGPLDEDQLGHKLQAWWDWGFRA